MEVTTEPVVRHERHGAVSVISIDRPSAMNAVDGRVATGIGVALDEADCDLEVRAIVITGTGDAFCAGADLKALARGESLDARGRPEWGFAGYVRHAVATPTIAAVNGFALGGGTEIVLASDLAVLDPSATLGLPEVRRGLMAAAGGVIRIQRQIPLKRALEMALTGEPVTAQVAVEWGLANRVSAPGAALAEALDLAGRIAENAPLAVRETKAMVHATAHFGSDWDDEPWALNNRAIGRLLRSDDFREGARAFAEKRRPAWTGS
ncbi:enoyl-CoA hydratase-related protein [Aeromicrobium ginsengisoli]|uniref:enoyl-CoA hydratase-related protein n=1 Tax=Aeromicrobium ginsengisoli TaxID=363867 RepID=UPI001CB717E5|nr:enoyl-CoA hydratase-related protein [Aeromicrobium ginsengisoli]